VRASTPNSPHAGRKHPPRSDHAPTEPEEPSNGARNDERAAANALPKTRRQTAGFNITF
jgi:hypothetical protein